MSSNNLLTNDSKISSNRSFGIVFFVFFLIISSYPLLNNRDINLWFLLISLIFLLLGLTNPKILTPLNKAWFKLGILLGRVVSPLIMGIIFFFVVTPSGFIMKIFRKDLLQLRYNKKKSYWIEKKGLKSKMKDQF